MEDDVLAGAAADQFVGVVEDEGDRVVRLPADRRHGQHHRVGQPTTSLKPEPLGRTS